MSAATNLHAAVLALVNLAGLLLGFLAFGATGQGNQAAVQILIGITASPIGFGLWVWAINKGAPRRFRYRSREDGGWTYLLALPWAAVIFVPLHYLTQGYLTSVSNILALWMFQLVTNAVVIGVVALVASLARRPVTPRKARGTRRKRHRMRTRGRGR
jgi:hypothetical protein